MSSVNRNFSFIFTLIFISFTFPFIITSPTATRDNPLDKFIEFLSKNRCSMPKEIKLPFSQTDPIPFSYLYTPLKICQSQEALKDNVKANLLCREVFDVLQNITCSEYNLDLPNINSGSLSENVCRDFAVIQDIIPKQDEYLSRKFGDNVICEVLCAEKYELLCKTLLWGYDTQAKIKNALAIEVEPNEEENINNAASNKDALNKKAIVVETETSVENHQMNEVNRKVIPLMENTQVSINGPNLNLVSTTTKSHIPDHTGINKNNTPSNEKIEKIIKLHNTPEEDENSLVNKVGAQTDATKDPHKNVHAEDTQPSQQNSNKEEKNLSNGENNIEKQGENVKVENPLTDINPHSNVNTFTPENKNSENKKSDAPLQVLPDKDKMEENSNSNINAKSSEKNESSVIPKTELYNDLNNVDLHEQENETKSKGKQTDLNKNDESPKESFISATSETDSKLLESTVLPLFPDKTEDSEHLDVKDQEYNDSENDGDYAKQEYDNPLISSKKESDVKNSVDVGSSQISSSSNIQISPETFSGHMPDGNQNYQPGRSYFPEQEDSHFFFYFLSIVLILMTGYLIFHNKQKIIALIVEGRHERRRRSHGAGYKKLETK